MPRGSFFYGMDRIELRQVLPSVFAETPPEKSDIWLRDNTIFRRGETCLLEAVSGAGKSSLCGYLFGYRRDYEGEILFDGKDVKRLSPKRWSALRNNSLAVMFQDLRLFPELTAVENVRLKNNLTHHKTEKEISELFEILGIAEKYGSLAGKLSFGQQQRVAFIRLLCQKADFMLLDEPTSHLDDRNSQIMSRILTEEAHAQGAAVIVTSIGKHFDISYDKILAL